MQRDFAREGLGYALRVPELALEFLVDRVSPGRDGFTCELVVSTALPGTHSSDGHLHAARFNLSSGGQRTTVAKLVRERSGWPEINWLDLLEDLCRRVLAAEREGQPIVKVGAKPVSLESQHRIDPLAPLDQASILYGDGGTGKSTLGAAIGVSVVTGVSVIPGVIPRRAPVLYLDWEAGEDAINRRVRGVAMGASIPGIVTLDYQDCRRRGPLIRFVEEVARAVQLEGYGLVIVDSVGMAAGVGNEGGDANEIAIRLFGAFGYLGTTILAIDHVNRNDADTLELRKARPYGSVYKANLARATWEVRRAEDTVVIHNTKVNDGPKHPPIPLDVVHAEDGSILFTRLEEIPGEHLAGPMTIAERLEAEINRALAEDSERLDAPTLAERLEVKPNLVRSVLNRNKRRFSRLPSGGWEVLPDVS